MKTPSTQLQGAVSSPGGTPFAVPFAGVAARPPSSRVAMSPRSRLPVTRTPVRAPTRAKNPAAVQPIPSSDSGPTPRGRVISSPEAGARPLIAVVFYRSYLVAADLAPVEAVFAAMRARGFDVIGLFAPSLKAPDAAKWLEENILKLSPKAIINATSFSGRGGNGRSPLDVAEVPVLQVALSTATKKAWSEAERGLSPADLAMHVVLPEVDGRSFAGVASCKEPQAQDPALEFSRFAHSPVPDRSDALADRIAAWHAAVPEAMAARISDIIC